jgi:uncharacterized protein YdeI (YjbR/CyaY-like superfamily)
MVTTPALEIKAFTTSATWAAWLKKHHDSSAGLWLRLYKKGSGTRSVNYAQALDEALCWGWIDGQARPFDETSWLTRFTPRRARSAWSKRNREHVARLQSEGRIQPSGWAQVQAAQADGRWDQAYDSPANAKVPDDFLQALADDIKALEFFQTLNRSNQYAIAYRLQTAKQAATRQRRFDVLLAMMKAGQRVL